jgi:hypothetical protein
MCVFLELYVSLETERESQRTVYSSNSNFSRNCLSHISLCFPNAIIGGNLKYILCVNTDLCYTQTYNGRKKRLVICVGRPAVMPKLIPQTCTDLCFAQICRIQNRIRQICAKRRLDTQIFFYRSSTAKIPVELQTGRLLSNSP